MSPPSADSHAFTLIELLVVLGIVGLLLGIVIPATKAMNDRTRLLQCKNNLRQLGVTLAIYRADHGREPDAFSPGKPFDGFNPTGLPPIYVPLSPYLKPGSPIYRCPADGRVWAETAMASGRGWGVSYNYNDQRFRKLVWQKRAARIPVMNDLVAHYRNANGVLVWSIPDPPHAGKLGNHLQEDGSVDHVEYDHL